MTTMAPAPRTFKIYRDAAIETIHATPAVHEAAAATPCSSPVSLRPVPSSTTTTAARATATATVSAPARLPPRKRSRLQQQQQSRPLGSLPSPSGGSGPAGGSSSNTSGWWDVSNKENIDPGTGKQQQRQQQQQRVSPFSTMLPVGDSSACSAVHPHCLGSSTSKKRPLCGDERCCASAIDNGGDGAGKPVALSSRKPSREPLKELWNRSSYGGKLSFPVYLNALGARTLR
ncbi:unnamed protein product [Ectocarpus sp. CCAP 1310/34]|nr:unnamed protein product [Ectocarpus sp. CCAP 1310/34]